MMMMMLVMMMMMLMLMMIASGQMRDKLRLHWDCCTATIIIIMTIIIIFTLSIPGLSEAESPIQAGSAHPLITVTINPLEQDEVLKPWQYTPQPKFTQFS